MYHHIFQTGKQVLVGANQFWQGENGNATLASMLKNFFLPLVLLVGLAVFAGELIVSQGFLLDYAVAKSMREIFSFTLQYLLSVYILNELLKSFGGTKDRHAVARVMAYSMLPSLIAAFFSGLFASLYVLNVLGLYGAAIFVWGVKGSLQLPAANQLRYIMMAFLLIILIFMMVNIFSWKLLEAFYGYGT